MDNQNNNPLSLAEIDDMLKNIIAKIHYQTRELGLGKKIIPRNMFRANTLLYRIYGYIVSVTFELSVCYYRHASVNMDRPNEIQKKLEKKRQNIKNVLPLSKFFTEDQLTFIISQTKKCEESYRVKRDKNMFTKLYEKLRGNQYNDLIYFFYETGREILCANPDEMTGFYPVQEQFNSLNTLFCGIGNKIQQKIDALPDVINSKLYDQQVPSEIVQEITDYLGPHYIGKLNFDRYAKIQDEKSMQPININVSGTSEVDGGSKRKKRQTKKRKQKKQRKQTRKSKRRY